MFTLRLQSIVSDFAQPSPSRVPVLRLFQCGCSELLHDTADHQCHTEVRVLSRTQQRLLLRPLAWMLLVMRLMLQATKAVQHTVSLAWVLTWLLMWRRG